MQEKERQIRELFDLTMKIAMKTDHHISFEIMTRNELTSLYVFDVNAEECRKIGDIYLYPDVTYKNDYEKIKEYLQEILEKQAA